MDYDERIIDTAYESGIEHGKKEGAKEELEKLVLEMKINQSGFTGFWNVQLWINHIEKRIEDLKRK